MKVARAPQRNDLTLIVEHEGDVLTLNGEAFDFSAVPEGGYVEGVPSFWIVGRVWRHDGEIELTVIEPYGAPDVEA